MKTIEKSQGSTEFLKVSQVLSEVYGWVFEECNLDDNLYPQECEV